MSFKMSDSSPMMLEVTIAPNGSARICIKTPAKKYQDVAEAGIAAILGA